MRFLSSRLRDLLWDTRRLYLLSFNPTCAYQRLEMRIDVREYTIPR
jgi:hypothetical protein